MKKQVSILLLGIILLLPLLAACGDNTATVVPTSRVAAITTAVPTTTNVTTTTNPVTTTTTANPTTTIAATTVAATTTTVASKTATPTVAAGANSTNLVELSLPDLPGFTRFPFTPQLLEQFKKQQDSEGDDNPLSRVKSMAFLGTQESSIDIAGSSVNNMVKSSGYTFAIPGYTNMLKLGKSSVLGVYSKSGQPDLFVSGLSTASMFKDGTKDSIPPEVVNFVKSNKLIFILAAGDGIVANFSKDGLPQNLPTIK